VSCEPLRYPGTPLNVGALPCRASWGPPPASPPSNGSEPSSEQHVVQHTLHSHNLIIYGIASYSRTTIYLFDFVQAHRNVRSTLHGVCCGVL